MQAINPCGDKFKKKKITHGVKLITSFTIVSTQTALSASTTMTSSTAEQPGNDEDGSFDLYDLRVEVVCPPGARILCGASAGDYFTLQGEMLYLPPGQGFSIYSIGTSHTPPERSSEHDTSYRSRSTPPRRETTRDSPSRLDDHGRRGCLP